MRELSCKFALKWYRSMDDLKAPEQSSVNGSSRESCKNSQQFILSLFELPKRRTKSKVLFPCICTVYIVQADRCMCISPKKTYKRVRFPFLPYCLGFQCPYSHQTNMAIPHHTTVGVWTAFRIFNTNKVTYQSKQNIIFIVGCYDRSI